MSSPYTDIEAARQMGGHAVYAIVLRHRNQLIKAKINAKAKDRADACADIQGRLERLFGLHGEPAQREYIREQLRRFHAGEPGTEHMHPQSRV